jgi:hypothetical protein
MTRIDIADYLGLTIATVSRTLTRLRAERLIEIATHSALVISDPAWAGGAGRRHALLLRVHAHPNQQESDTRQ